MGRSLTGLYVIRKKASSMEDTMVGKLLTWYGLDKRDLPWRNDGSVYAVLVSEMMLQQTTVDTVLRYYEPFMARFADIDTLAAADEQQVLSAWQGLGYYARARSLHKIAQHIASKGGDFPQTYDAWLALPGVGPYMAGAVMSIAFSKPYAAVDGNVIRVMSRLYAIRDDTGKPSVRRDITKRVQMLIPADSTADFTQALMELGALVCRPISPDCSNCPVCAHCEAFKCNAAADIPVKKKRQKKRTVALWAALIESADGLVMEYRRDKRLLKNMWGLPLREKKGDQPPDALFSQKYGIRLIGGGAGGQVVHVFTHLRWEIDIRRFSLAENQTLPAEWEWVKWAQIDTKPIPTAFKKALCASIADKEDDRQ